MRGLDRRHKEWPDHAGEHDRAKRGSACLERTRRSYCLLNEKTNERFSYEEDLDTIVAVAIIAFGRIRVSDDLATNRGWPTGTKNRARPFSQGQRTNTPTQSVRWHPQLLAGQRDHDAPSTFLPSTSVQYRTPQN